MWSTPNIHHLGNWQLDDTCGKGIDNACSWNEALEGEVGGNIGEEVVGNLLLKGIDEEDEEDAACREYEKEKPYVTLTGHMPRSERCDSILW